MLLIYILDRGVYLLSCSFADILASVGVYDGLRLDTSVVDIGPPADWVKINVQKTVSLSCVWIAYNLFNYVIYSSRESCVQKDCFEVYALVPGLLREEVIKSYFFFLCNNSAHTLKSWRIIRILVVSSSFLYIKYINIMNLMHSKMTMLLFNKILYNNAMLYFFTLNCLFLKK